MNRRTFLRRFSVGVVATAALASIPASALQSIGLGDAAQDWAIKKLTKAYNDYWRAHRKTPREFIIGRDLFDAFEGQLIVHHRFVFASNVTDGPIPDSYSLCFKSCRVRWEGRGYEITHVS